MTDLNNTADIQTLILAALVESQESAYKLAPHLKPEYFETDEYRILFISIHAFITEYAKTPPIEAIQIDLNKKSITEAQYQGCLMLLRQLYAPEIHTTIRNSLAWVVIEAEQFCIDRSIYLAIQKAIKIIDGSEKMGKGAIPKLMQDALNVSFDVHVGHDYIDDSDERYEFYHHKEKHISTGLRDLDHILQGGYPNKSLMVFVAPTGVGKSTILCNSAVEALIKGENVLYVTCEMADKKIGERIDANLMETPIHEIINLKIESYRKKISDIRAKTTGKLVIKEYPPATANVNHIRGFLDELRLKKNFKPTIIMLDYLSLMASIRMKTNDNLYAYGKTIAEEVRGLAVELGIPIVTAVQTNRAGQNDSDFELTEVAESHGVSMTADAMIAMISQEQLEKINQVKMKQLKNRYGPIDKPRTFQLGIDRAQMRLFDVNQNHVPTEPVKQPMEYGAKFPTGGSDWKI